MAVGTGDDRTARVRGYAIPGGHTRRGDGRRASAALPGCLFSLFFLWPIPLTRRGLYLSLSVLSTDADHALSEDADDLLNMRLQNQPEASPSGASRGGLGSHLPRRTASPNSPTMGAGKAPPVSEREEDSSPPELAGDDEYEPL